MLLPSKIDISHISRLIKSVELVSTSFVDGDIIGYLEQSEDASCVYKPIKNNKRIDYVLQKDIESHNNIKHASTEREYDKSVKETFIKYQDIVNFIQTKGGTCDESVVLCCITQSTNPVNYTVVKGGPLDVKAGRQSSSKSESSDFLCFGPVYTSFHSDVGYAHRNSLIPSWNQGVIKFWIIRRECDSKTQRYAVTNPRRLLSSSFTALDELNKVLKYPEDYLLLIQRPGQFVRHNGKHVHCVITAIDIEVNPSSLSLSLGRKDYYPQDNYAFASSTKETLVVASKKKGTFKHLSRDAFIKKQLTSEDKKILKSQIEADASRRTRSTKRKGGFQIGNEFSKSKSSKK